mmetsp:Transcript_27947/g.47203  ORF Transcript_27947/g.47203 Transcript_27947/m.47203 type:complete len:770 (+) Transcript_27947:44-2353(+)
MFSSLFFLALLGSAVALVAKSEIKVSFDNRAFLINGERTLFVAGSVHYPRASSAEWPVIIQSAKDNGINLIQIYVFWDIHEPEEGVFHFPQDGSSADLVGFLRECEKANILVNLRFGPYVCAEWNYGGFPVWLRNKEGVVFRTMNDIFLEKMALFVDATLDVVTEAGLMAQDGGPIVMLQIENEYGNMEHFYPRNGAKYVQWAAEYALSKNLSVPWMMCQQGEGVGTAPPKEVINTCNGYYCDNWIERHAAAFPSQPHMWTENWPGWYQKWGEAVPHRPSVDVTFAVARWFAKGGTFMNYYMAFGGTSFGRDVGGPLIVTSYDYDVQINEYVLPAEPKFSLTQKLHKTLHSSAPVILAHDSIPSAVPLTSTCESHAYDQHPEMGCVTFLSNWGTSDECVFNNIGEASFSVPAWSVSVITDTCSSTPNLVMNTKTDAEEVKITTQTPVDIGGLQMSPFEVLLAEKVPSSAKDSGAIISSEVLDQLALTNDSTDYLWTSSTVSRDKSGAAVLSFSISTDGGPVLYVFVNGILVGSSVDDDSTVDVMLTRLKDEKLTGKLAKTVETMEFSVDMIEGENKVDILFASMGLKNYGPYLEKVRVGIVSDIQVDGKKLAEYSYSVGLSGERQQLAQTPLTKVSTAETAAATPTWYRSTFTTPEMDSATPALAVDFSHSSAKKGAVWVNGFMLGRYWDIKATTSGCQGDAQCSSAAYTGAYADSRCRTGCGERSQSLYKIPLGLLHSAGSTEPNTIVILDEFGSSPEGLSVKQVVMM